MSHSNNYIFEGYSFSIDNLDCFIYDDEWNKGIIYNTPEGKFDICFNKVGWARIIINYKDNSFKDLPFNQNTLEFLPKEIRVVKL